MKKQVFMILGILVLAAGMIFFAARYGERNQFEYKESLEETVFILDGKDYPLSELSYYIAKQEMKIEGQAKLYNAENTNEYWGLHTNGEFLRLAGKKAVLDMAVHDILLYTEAKEQGIELSKEEQEYVKNSASDFCYDLNDEQKQKAGIVDEQIYEMTEKSALAEKYQKILAKKNGQNFGAYDYSGKAYEKMLEEHNLEVREKFWEKIPFGEVTLNHGFEK